MIYIEDLHLSYGSKEILKGIDLKVKKGETLTIIGPSGSGKTTLLRSINLLERPSSGTITIDEEKYDYSNISKAEMLKIRRKTSMVFQDYALFANKTALENITLALTVPRKMNLSEAKKIGIDLLNEVGLSNQENKYPNQLSGGQQQRIGIARALAVKPDVILFDEPTSSLDPELIGEVLSIIRKLADKGITMIIVTHEMGFAYDVSDKIVLLEEGNILEEGDPEQIMRAPKNKRTKEFLQQTYFNMQNSFIIPKDSIE